MFKIFYNILILFPKLIIYLKPTSHLLYLEDKKILKSQKLGKLHPNNTLKGNFISFIILLIDIEEIINFQIFKNFDFKKIFKKKKKIKEFSLLFF